MNDAYLFHDFKHHLSTIKQFLVDNKKEVNEEVLFTLKSLGNSKFDLYLGALNVDEILKEIREYLVSNSLINKDNYKQWIASSKGYRQVKLSDDSTWTLRYLEQTAYVHIHPSRYAKHTVRIGAKAMKTALLLKLNDLPCEHDSVNAVRLLLQLSPISKHSKMEGIKKAYALCSIK